MEEEKEIRTSLFLAIDLTAIQPGVPASFWKTMYVGQEKISLIVKRFFIEKEDKFNLLIQCRGKEIQPAVMLTTAQLYTYCKLRNIDLLGGWHIVWEPKEPPQFKNIDYSNG